MHDDEKVAMQVLDEIRDLIQDRIGGSLKPDAVEVKSISVEPDKSEMGSDEPPMGDDDLSGEDAGALASLWESEGVGSEKDDDAMKRMKGNC